MIRDLLPCNTHGQLGLMFAVHFFSLCFSSDSSSHSSPPDVETPGPRGPAGEKQGRRGLQVEPLEDYPDRSPASALSQVPQQTQSGCRPCSPRRGVHGPRLLPPHQRCFPRRARQTLECQTAIFYHYQTYQAIHCNHYTNTPSCPGTVCPVYHKRCGYNQNTRTSTDRAPGSQDCCDGEKLCSGDSRCFACSGGH